MKGGDSVTDAQFGKNITQILQCEKTGLRDIFDEYSSMIYRIMLQTVKSHHDAQDLTSEFFIKLWSIADRYKKGNGHKTWLVTIARNMAIDFIRSEKESVSFDNEENGLKDTMISNDNTEQKVVEKISFEEAVNILNSDEKEILDLHLLAELTFKETAEILNISHASVSWKYYEALKKVRVYMEGAGIND